MDIFATLVQELQDGKEPSKLSIREQATLEGHLGKGWRQVLVIEKVRPSMHDPECAFALPEIPNEGEKDDD